MKLEATPRVKNEYNAHSDLCRYIAPEIILGMEITMLGLMFSVWESLTFPLYAFKHCYYI